MTKYSAWTHYFEQNHWPDFPVVAPSLTSQERRRIAPSIRQFQLGEASGGHTFLRRGREFADVAGEPDYPRSLALFIAEEQRHAAALGRFMEGEGIPRQSRDATDSLFRFFRKLWNHEVMVTVLVSAECVAVPYYSALHDATESAGLRALCRQILRDEAMHLKYQGQTLARLLRGRNFWLATLARTWQLAAVVAASLVVFAQHRQFFREAGWRLEDVLDGALQALGEVQSRYERRRRLGLCYLKPGA